MNRTRSTSLPGLAVAVVAFVAAGCRAARCGRESAGAADSGRGSVVRIGFIDQINRIWGPAIGLNIRMGISEWSAGLINTWLAMLKWDNLAPTRRLFPWQELEPVRA